MVKVLEQKLSNDYKNLMMKCDEVLEPTAAKDEKEKANIFLGANKPKVGDLKVKLLMTTPVKEEKVAKKFYDPDNKNVVITGGTTEEKEKDTVKPCSILQQLAIDR